MQGDKWGAFCSFLVILGWSDAWHNWFCAVSFTACIIVFMSPSILDDTVIKTNYFFIICSIIWTVVMQLSAKNVKMQKIIFSHLPKLDISSNQTTSCGRQNPDQLIRLSTRSPATSNSYQKLVGYQSYLKAYYATIYLLQIIDQSISRQ